MFKVLLAALTITVGAQAQTAYTLDQCRRMALDNNIKIRSARYDIEAAKSQQRDAKMAYFPTVSATGAYFHANDYLMKDKVTLTAEQQQQMAATVQGLGLDPTALAGMPSEFTIEAIKHGVIVSLMAMEPVYAGGRITTGNKLANLQTEVKQLQLEQSQNDVRQTVERYYWQIVSLHEKQRTLDAAEAQLRSIKRDADNAVNAGVALKNDQLTVELKLNEIAANRIKLDNGLRLARLVLGQYIGIEGEAEVVQTQSLATTQTSQPAQDSTSAQLAEIAAPATLFIAPDEALQRRVESQLLDKSVEAQQLQKRMKQGERLPSLAVGVAASYNDMTSISREKLIGLATLSVPISDWWSSTAVKRQQIAVEKAKEEREDNLQLLKIQMQSCYDNLDAAYQQVQIAQKSIEQSEENLRMNRDFYQAGTSSMSDLLDAQTKHQQAKDQMTDALVEYQNARTAYLVATGR